jgi:DNA polymerase-3 subunit delta
VVLWALARELRLINTIKSELKAGASAESRFGRYRLWDSRKAAMSQALQRLNQSTIHEAILLSGRADRIIKGMASGDEWDALLAICISLMKAQSSSNSTRH